MSDDALTDSEQRLVDDAIAFATTEIEPRAEQWERERRFASEAFAALPGAGLTALLVPSALGGRGVGEVALARVLEELAAADLGAAFSAVVHNNMARAVANSGNEHLIGELLPRLVSGEVIGAFLLTEPGVGSDAAAITCSATLDGDEWVISGSKAWATSASHAGSLNLYAQTDPQLKHRGIVSIVVDPSLPGVTRLEPYELMGAHSMGTGGFEFNEVRVPVANTLAPVGQAFAGAMVGIDLARVLVGAMCCGMLRRALDTALAYTAQRQLFGSSVADKQGVQWMLADVATDLEATRLLTFRAARQLQDGEDATLTAAHAKKFAARKAQERIADCMQVMGAAGYRRDGDQVAGGNPLPRHLAAARLTGYIDGATEIQNVVIARRLWDRVPSTATATITTASSTTGSSAE
ncbi:MAG: acyl-CoA dehydrogenase family protein [Acidimicrobiales bacterium]